ncbi:MAG: hypothetical protein QOD49_41 [Actinomycetota bacterium]|nr:hypothetical protein [Actinomycetota bacterium]
MWGLVKLGVYRAYLRDGLLRSVSGLECLEDGRQVGR